MLLYMNELLSELNSSYFLAETYIIPTLWTNLFRLSTFAIYCAQRVTLESVARPYFAAAYKPLHGILRQALLHSDLPSHSIREMGVRDETNWRYQPIVMMRVFQEFHEALERSRDILLNNFSGPNLRFPFFEAIRLLAMGFARLSPGPEFDIQMYEGALFFLKDRTIPEGVPVSNSPSDYAYMTTPPVQGATEERISELATYVATEDNDGLCVICQDNFEVGEDICFLPCDHCFHSNCVHDWLVQNDSCPIDRTRI